ncbi:MAG TPA: MFS transporter [Acidobacteriaceae bacterium]|nr:MFS transporter [Acidobacteriaceae bacterium]
MLKTEKTTDLHKVTFYGRYLLVIAGLGGLLYGADIGIIAAALLYVGKTIELTLEQTSLIVAAVLGGSMISSLLAGVLADWLGRRWMMILSGLMFVVSVAMIVLSQGFVSLFAGRLLQGMSGGVIAVVVPLYLAECLSADYRGRGTAIFQFFLTFGIAAAAFVGWYYTRQAETAMSLAAGNAVLLRAIENHAWRSMFLAVVYPGALFFAGTFPLSETPRWLARKGRIAEARKALERSVSAEEAERELAEMQSLQKPEAASSGLGKSLLQRKYVVPFVLACVVLSLNQTTGINSILSFLVLILRQAGMSAGHATQGDVFVKVMNVVMTLVAVFFVDRKGRRFLLRMGTAGVVIALACGGFLFLRAEAARINVRNRIVAAETGNTVHLPINEATTLGSAAPGRVMALTVVYSYGGGEQVATVLSDNPHPVLDIAPEAKQQSAPLTIRRAMYGPVPSRETGWLVAACLAVFIMAYAVGPGVVVWLMLSELMPTRIRSTGMGIALLLNQGISTLIAGVFLPVVGNYGYAVMFFGWAACTLLYFATAIWWLPETKGKSLEEIEMFFERPGATQSA